MKFAVKDKKKSSTSNNWNLLIVDDEAEVHNITKTVLKKFDFKEKGLNFFSAYSGKEAIEILKENPNIDVVLLDVIMETDDAGLIVAKKIREELHNHHIRIILRTGQPGLYPPKDIIVNYDIDDYKEKTELTSTKLYIMMVASLRNSEYIKTINNNKKMLEKINKDILDTQKEMIERITEMIEIRSHETANHVKRVASISYILAKAYGLSEDESTMLKLASPMHDIGKLGIPDDILQKPGKLEPSEFEIMKTHVELGFDIFKGSKKDILKTAAIVAHQHHEKWDGTGYPQGLKGEDIHIFGRITSIADVFDSLTQKRVYKEPWSIEKVLDFFNEHKGTHFEPKLVELFIENIEEIVKYQDGNNKEL